MSEIHSLGVFCGSKTGADAAHAETARRLGVMLVEKGLRLVYGGGAIGLMGVVAKTVLDSGGEVTGVIPDFLMKYEVGNPGVTELIVVDSMHERKRRMFDAADAFLILPGGLGTLDETFEIITWKQLQLHTKPIVILNGNGYWRHFTALIDSIIEGDFAHPAVRELFTVVDGLDDVFAALASAPEPREIVFTDHL